VWITVHVNVLPLSNLGISRRVYNDVTEYLSFPRGVTVGFGSSAMLPPSSNQLTFTWRGLNPEDVQRAVSVVCSTTGMARVTCGTVGRTEMDYMYNHTRSGWIARLLDKKGYTTLFLL